MPSPLILVRMVSLTNQTNPDNKMERIDFYVCSIAHELKNPSAAENTVSGIRAKIKI